MKLMNLDHIAAHYSRKCNFNCSYCIGQSRRKGGFGLWDTRIADIITFLNSLPKKMIMVSGGEPIIFNKFERIIKETNHYWYFLSNCSVVNPFLKKEDIRKKLKLIIGAFHQGQIRLEKFIANVIEMRELGYPVFVKKVYGTGKGEGKIAEKIISAGIPFSFSPLIPKRYSEKQISQAMDYCQSSMYASRFFPPPKGPNRKPAPCVAGTARSFTIKTDLSLRKCSHFQDVSLGTIYQPKFYESPRVCARKCACEWHSFSDMASFHIENQRWQHFIDTGEWETISREQILTEVRQGNK